MRRKYIFIEALIVIVTMAMLLTLLYCCLPTKSCVPLYAKLAGDSVSLHYSKYGNPGIVYIVSGSRPGKAVKDYNSFIDDNTLTYCDNKYTVICTYHPKQMTMLLNAISIKHIPKHTLAMLNAGKAIIIHRSENCSSQYIPME